MTKISTLSTVLIISISFFSCSKGGVTTGDPDTPGNWIRRSDLDGVARGQAVGMVIGDTAYLATGKDGTSYMKDVWRYNPDGNNWSQRANLPGEGRAGAIAFTIGTKAYLGTGFNAAGRLKDFWEYNATTNQWARKTDFLGTARYGAAAFAINNKGYITTGYDGNDLNDFYEYNPAADTAGATTSPWLAKQDMSGTKRSGAVAFVYQGKAYLCTGGSGTGTSFIPATDMWMFDPANGTWTKRKSISDASPDPYDDHYSIIRKNAVAFVMNDRAYVSTGENGKILRDTWEYDFASDLWFQKTDFEGVDRSNAVGFAVKNRGFVVSGNNSAFYFSDLREFMPLAAYNVND